MSSMQYNSVAADPSAAEQLHSVEDMCDMGIGVYTDIGVWAVAAAFKVGEGWQTVGYCKWKPTFCNVH